MRETPNGMPRQSLAQYFSPGSRPAREIAVSWRQGYRMERWSWGKLSGVAAQFARDLEARGINRGDRIFLWGPNTGEWLAVFIGCLLRSAIVVPMDAIAAPEFAQRVIAEAAPRLAVISRDLPPPAGIVSIALEDLAQIVSARSPGPYDSSGAQRSDALEIVFTSGTTAEPRGVVLTHGNVLSNLEPIEREIARYRKYERFFHPLKFLNLLPLSHVFGQMLGIFIPQILGATAIFLDSLRPADVAATIRRRARVRSDHRSAADRIPARQARARPRGGGQDRKVPPRVRTRRRREIPPEMVALPQGSRALRAEILGADFGRRSIAGRGGENSGAAWATP